MDGSPEDLAIRARWKQGFGNIPERLDAYLAGNARLDAIWVEVGTNDEYPWIPQGAFTCPASSSSAESPTASS
jgi:hypothetical protein